LLELQTSRVNRSIGQSVNRLIAQSVDGSIGRPDPQEGKAATSAKALRSDCGWRRGLLRALRSNSAWMASRRLAMPAHATAQQCTVTTVSLTIG